MRRLMLVAALVLVIAAAYRIPGDQEQTGTGTLTLAQPAPTPGEEIYNFEAERLNGEEFELSDQGVYVLSFWSALNRGSQSAHPDFEQLAREYGGQDVSFAAVYVGSVPRTDRNDAPYAVIKDSSGELTSKYNVKRVPRVFLIEDGEVRLTQDGFYEENQRQMKQTLEETLRAEA